MQVRLEVSHNKANIKRVVIQDKAVLGRSAECNLRIASGQVSRQHCQISISESEVFVTDLGSSNGTFIDGERVPPNEPFAVKPGAELSVGPARFIFRFDPPELPNEVEPVVGDAVGDAITDLSINDPGGDDASAEEDEELTIGLSGIQSEDAESAADEPEPEAVPEEKAVPAGDAPIAGVESDDDAPDLGFLNGIEAHDTVEEPVAFDAEPEEDKVSKAADEREPEVVLESPADPAEAEVTPEPVPEPVDDSMFEVDDDEIVEPEAAPSAVEIPDAEPVETSAEDDAFSFLNEVNDDDGGDEDLGDFLKQFE